MSIPRRVVRVVQTPAPAPGFIGAGHTAVLVVDPNEFGSLGTGDVQWMTAGNRRAKPLSPEGGR